MRELIDLWGCSNGFNVAGVKAELEFIYRTLEQEEKAAHVRQRDKDGATQKYCKSKECDDKEGDLVNEPNGYCNECLFSEFFRDVLEAISKKKSWGQISFNV